jgi:peptide/nickel transport system permease protein
MIFGIFKRISSLLLILLGAILVVHTLIYLIPGDPALVIAGEYANPDDIEKIREELSLDESFLMRYLAYLKRMISLDLGRSIYSGIPVAELIWERFPATLVLAAAAMLLAGMFGVIAGVVAAVFKKTIWDDMVLWISSIFISTPIFVTCILLSLIFSYYLNLLPPSGRDGLNPAYLILPTLALASRSLALIIRVVRNEMVDVLSTNYIKTARSLGFSELRVVFIFALKNIIVPVITIVLLDFGAYLGGAVVTESVFSWPGIGRTLIVALYKRDIPVMQGIILFGTVLFIILGIVIDLLQRIVIKREE